VLPEILGYIRHLGLGDIRNLRDHSKLIEPSTEQMRNLAPLAISTGGVSDPERNMNTRDITRYRPQMLELIVKKYVRLQLAKKRSLVNPTEKEDFVRTDAPVSKGSNHALVRGGIPSRHNGAPYLRFVSPILFLVG
jgi:hypothetical protein